MVVAVDLLAQARAGQPSIDEIVELVTTGPEAGGTNRDTQVVVQDLFRNAERSVLVAGYELYQAEPLFARSPTSWPRNPPCASECS
jgi:hypothetical protein